MWHLATVNRTWPGNNSEHRDVAERWLACRKVVSLGWNSTRPELNITINSNCIQQNTEDVACNNTKEATKPMKSEKWKMSCGIVTFLEMSRIDFCCQCKVKSVKWKIEKSKVKSQKCKVKVEVKGTWKCKSKWKVQSEKWIEGEIESEKWSEGESESEKWSLFGPLFFLKLIYSIYHVYTFIAIGGKKCTTTILWV